MNRDAAGAAPCSIVGKRHISCSHLLRSPVSPHHPLTAFGSRCSRSHLVSTPDFRYPVSASSMMDSHSEHYSGALVLRRPQKGRVAALRDEPSKVSCSLLHQGFFSDGHSFKVYRSN